MMKINVASLNNLIRDKFRNNKAYFADEIGVDRAYLSSILNGNGKNDSPKVCNAIIRYCKLTGLNCETYIIFL